MKKQVIVWLKNGMIAKMNAETIPAMSHQVHIPSTAVDLPLVIVVKHQGLSTLIDLTGMNDCVVLQFGADRYFTGATYFQHCNTGAFMIQSQARFILLMPLPLPFPLEETEELQLKATEA